MTLSAETIAVIKATAPVVAEHALEITKTFYPKLFANNPEVLAFFNRGHQKQSRQPRSLADAVVAYASNIEDLTPLGPLVARIAERHVALSIKPEHYQIVHDNLMLAVAEVLGDAATPEVAKAWSEAVMQLAKICIDAEEALYKRNESRSGGWRYEREFVVTSREQIAEDVVKISFSPEDGQQGPSGFQFTPGQYITVRAQGPTNAPRHYTIVSAPGEAEISVAVRHVKDGELSTFLHEALKVGDKVQLGAPCGIFTPPSEDKPAVLVSAGIGITPMVSFLAHFKPKELVRAAFHVEHTEKRHAFKDVFEQSGVPCTVVYTEGKGKPDLAAAAKDLFAKGGADAQYYMCGPTSFLADMRAALLAAGVEESSVRYEIFGTGTIESNAACEKEVAATAGANVNATEVSATEESKDC